MIKTRHGMILSALILALLASPAESVLAKSSTTTSATPTATTSLAISIVVSGDDYNGDPQFALLLNGAKVATETVTAVHGKGQWQTINLNETVSGTPQTLGIDFLNDAYNARTAGDRNLYVQDVIVNGTTLLPKQGKYQNKAGTVLLSESGTLSWNVSNLFPTSSTPLACGSTPSGQTTTQSTTTTGSIAATTAQCTFGGTVPTTTVTTQLQLCTNGALSNDGSPASTTTNGTPVCNAPLACGSTPSGQTATKTVGTTTGSIAATTAQCAFGGTVPTTTVTTQLQLCTNGTLSNDGSAVSTTTNGTPVCNAALACGSTPSGQTINQPVGTTTGSIAATAAQCPFGGTVPTTTVTTQLQLCTNGALSNDGSAVSTTTNGTPICNAAAACGSTPSGQTTTQTVSTTSGSIAATTAQCTNGGTVPTTTVVTQLELCTNGALSADGSPVSTTTNGTPVCNAPAPVNGLVGSAKGKDFSTLSAASANLCSAGTVASFVTTSTGWTWSCAGSNGGTTDSSGAALLIINASCGSANGVTVSTKPASNLCTVGTASAVAGSGPWTWSCAGSNGGTNASCSAPLQSVAVNGTCGAANGVAVSAAPSTGLCVTGTASTVAGTGPWTWSCAGSSGGTNATCSAPLQSTAANGQCGASNGVYTNTQPASGLCLTGTASAISGNGPWSWTCASTTGGSTASCEAYVAGLLTTDRDFSANWGMAGLQSVGGIPNRTTVCATLKPLGNGADDSTQINSAISSCAAGDVVSLAAGTFTIAEGKSVQINKGVSLRGAGAGTTILTRTGGATINSYIPGNNPSPMISLGGSGKVAATTTLASDGIEGSYSVNLTSASGVSVGSLVHIDELALGQAMPDATFNNGTGTVWAEPDYRVEWNAHNPTVQYFDSTNYSNTFTGGDACAYSYRCGGVNEEYHLVTAVNGNTVTFDTPLTLSYRVANNAQAHIYTNSATNIVPYAGVEKMTVEFGDAGNVNFNACIYCWAYQVESLNWLNGGFVLNGSAFRDQIEMSYVHNAAWPVNGGAGYAFQLTYGASEDYIVNNIDMLTDKVDVVRASGSGVVFAYNYMDDGYINGSDDWVETGLNCSHLAGSHGCLFEGNYSFNTDSDFTHGNSTHSTYFRNWLTGYRAPFTGLDGKFVDDANQKGNGPKRAIGDHAYSYWDSFIGNIAGTPGKMSGWVYRCASGEADSGCAPSIINLGWNDTSVAGSLADPSMEVSFPTQPTGITAPGCLSSGSNCAPIVDGNFDYLTNTIQWATNDGAHELPNSFYLSQEPAFFNTGSGYTWPWVDPIHGTVYKLPAKARWDAGTPFTQP